jgi:succinate dehydrogenase / fumarate reductase cytochrome b subunit
MRRALSLYSTSVGKKAVMAVTGLVLLAFVVAHLVGNLKVYQGPDKYDAYARFLREAGAPVFGHGQLLWLVRVVLIVAVVLHVVAAVQLSRANLAARAVGYHRSHDLSFSYASRTMRWGGVVIGGFVVYHVMHLTWGVAHPEFGHSVHANLVLGFRDWRASSAYVLAMIPLCLHIYHGIWSATQTLALDDERAVRWRRPVAGLVAAGIFLGNVSIPLAVLTGLVR